jgi:hypothetical protein
MSKNNLQIRNWPGPIRTSIDDKPTRLLCQQLKHPKFTTPALGLRILKMKFFCCIFPPTGVKKFHAKNASCGGGKLGGFYGWNRTGKTL